MSSRQREAALPSSPSSSSSLSSILHLLLKLRVCCALLISSSTHLLHKSIQLSRCWSPISTSLMMYFLSFLSFSITTLVLATKASASDFPAKIWTSSSDGTISTLQLTYTNDSYRLTKIATSTACSDSPSWLTYSAAFQNLYCVGYGSLNTLSVGKDGSLTSQSSSKALDGGVNAIIYHANTSNFIALAHQ